MTHCVPDWDGHGGELDAIIATTEYLPAVTGKWGSLLLPKGSPASNLASLQSSDVPSGWTEIGPVALKSDVHGAKSPEWQVNCNNWAISRPGTAGAIPPPKPATSEQLPSVVSNGVLAVNVPVIDPTMNSTMIGDDEMVSWLQYPLDDTLEKSYCSEFFGDIPNSTVASVQAIKDSLAVGQHATHAGRLGCRTLATVPGGMNGSMSRVVSADAAMAMGAGRAAGFLPQAGVEAFTKVRTQQPYAGKWCVSSSTAAASNPGRTVEASTSVSHQHHQQHQQQQQPSRESPVMGMGTSSALPNVSSSPALAPLKAQAAPLQFTTAQKTRNFSHFSLPVVNMKASLQCLGVSHGNPAQNRLRTSYQLPSLLNASGRPFDAAASSGSSIAESTTTRLNSEEASRDESDVRGVEGPSEQQPSLAIEATSWPSAMPTNSLSPKGTAEVPVSSIAGNHADFESRVADPHESRPVEAENGQNSNDRSNAAATPSTTDTTATPHTQNPEAPEPTLTSSSGGSGNTSKGVVAKRKRRTREQEESEIQSEDAEDEVVELKKPQQRTNNSKRSRAAEVHNLSERRRRDRINEKMKALQELIPNSNKADKASMLDEAIEYLKMLRIQLQMMSMRSGMSIPLIPNGMQHLQVPQMGGMPPIGMGLGMGLGLGMVGMGGMGPMPMGHMLDMNSMAAAGRTSHLIPHLSHAHGGAASHSGSPMMPHHQMPSHGGASYNVSQTMDVYNAYMIHQQQQQQHQYQQQQHQHQQQHQVHHLASNLGGGSLQ